MKKNIIFQVILILSISLLFMGTVFAEPIHLKMATTTSTENSGLLAKLLPPFEEKYNIKVDVIAVGTGAAMKLRENGTWKQVKEWVQPYKLPMKNRPMFFVTEQPLLPIKIR